MSNLDKIIKLLRSFAKTVWPAQAKNIIDESYQMYAYMLQTIPYEVLFESMGILAQTKTFWPSISEIREVAASLKHTAQGQDLTPAEAWGQVYQHVLHHTPLTDPTVKQCYEMIGGYPSIAYVDASGISIIRAQFMRMFEQIQTVHRIRERNLMAISNLPAEQQKQLAATNQLTIQIIKTIPDSHS